MSSNAQGIRAWILQRLTAVYIAIYALSLIVWLWSNAPVDYNSWFSFFSHPVMLIATIIFYVSIFIHAWLGIRDILVDYVKPNSARFISLTVLALFLVVMTTWLLLIVIRLVKI